MRKTCNLAHLHCFCAWHFFINAYLVTDQNFICYIQACKMSCLASMINSSCGCVIQSVRYDDKPLCRTAVNSSLSKRCFFAISKWDRNRGFARQPCCKAGTMKIFCMRKKIYSHKKKNLLFLPCNVAAMQNLYTLHKSLWGFLVKFSHSAPIQ